MKRNMLEEWGERSRARGYKDGRRGTHGESVVAGWNRMVVECRGADRGTAPGSDDACSACIN